MNIQEQVNISNNLRNNIKDLVNYLSNVWYEIDEDLCCPYEVIIHYSGWELQSFYCAQDEDYLETNWCYSEAWEDNYSEETFFIPIEWLQWYLDGDKSKINESFLEHCKSYTDRLNQGSRNDCINYLRRAVEEFGRDNVLDMLYGG